MCNSRTTILRLDYCQFCCWLDVSFFAISSAIIQLDNEWKRDGDGGQYNVDTGDNISSILFMKHKLIINIICIEIKYICAEHELLQPVLKNV